LVRPEGAEVLASYKEDFYADVPVITVNRYGDGRAYYVGTSSDEEFYDAFLADVCAELQIVPVFAPVEQVEVTRRVNEQGSYLFILNHNNTEVTLTMESDGTDLLRGVSYVKGQTVSLPAKDVMIYAERF
jgi:beta-galactosidase